MKEERLSWINRLYTLISGRLFFRAADSVLIAPPNQVYRLNAGGIRMLSHLESGKPIQTFPGLSGEERIAETERFFRAVEELFVTAENGRYSGSNPAFEPVAYDFSYTALPILAEIAVTYRCNNRCGFCYVPAAQNGGPSPRRRRRSPCRKQRVNEMPAKKIKRVIDIFSDEAQVPFFSFTGGEPLLRREIEMLTEHAAGRGLTVNLVSNGSLCTRERARALRNAGLASAQISIEAPEGKTHDYLAGRKGAFTETLKGIESIQTAGIPVQTNTTLNKKNRESVLQMPAFLRSIGIRRFAVNLFIPAGAGLDHRELFLSYSDAAPLITQIDREARRLGMSFFWYSPTPYCIFNPLASGLGNKSCAAADGLLSVSPSGDVLPCSSYAEPIGNLFRDGFEKTWFSKRAKYFKHKHFAPEECSGCPSFHACQGACPLYWQFAGTGEICGIKGGSDARAAV